MAIESRRAGLLLSLMVWAMACGSPVAEDSVDLALAFALAEVHGETPTLDFGTRAARSHLDTGWSWDETSDGMTYVWGLGSESSLEFFLTEPRDLRATLRCFPFSFRGAPGQSVTVAVNGAEVTAIELEPRVAAYELDLPASVLRVGTNQLTMTYAYSQSPAAVSRSSDQRQLAVGWDSLVFSAITEPGAPAVRSEGAAPELYLPFGTEVVYYLDLPAAGRLAVDDLSVRGDGRLRVFWQVDGEETRELVFEREVALPASSQPFRLTLQALGRPGAEDGESSWTGIRLAGPSVRWPRESSAAAPTSPLMEESADSGGPGEGGKRPNVLVYLVDTLRADRLGCYGQPLPLTPHVDQLAEEGIVFARTLAQTSWTKPAVASILTGLRPIRHGVNNPTAALPEDARTLAETLRDAGYRTAAFVTNAHITSASGFDQGFDHFDFSYDPAHDLNARVLAWLDRGAAEKPFFAYVHTIDPHAPYAPNEPFRERFAPGVDPALGDDLAVMTDENVADLLRLYNAEVAQNDDAFGLLRDGLSQRDLDAGTIIVFLSDHGDAFREHGVFGHGRDLYQEVLDVPFVLRLPDGPHGVKIQQTAQHVDLFPTLLDALGLPPHGAPGGRSLLGFARGEEALAVTPIFSYLDYDKRQGLSVVWGEWKLIEPLGARFAPSRELYLPWTDPLETRNLATEQPVLSGYLASLTRGEARQLEDSLPETEAVLDAVTRDALKALGYL